MSGQTADLFRALLDKGQAHSDGIELKYAQPKGELTMVTTLFEAKGEVPADVRRVVGSGHRADDGVSQAMVALENGRVHLTYLTHIGVDEEQAFGEAFSDYCLLANEWRSVLEME